MPLLAQQVIVTGPDLEPKTVSLDDISLADEGLLRLSANPVAPLNDKHHVARLVDGQVLMGTLLGAGEDGESIRMSFGDTQRTVVLALDDLLSLSRAGTAMQGDGADDTLLLATGETLVGFVDSVGDQSIGFVVGDVDTPVEVPMDRVRGFSIANKPEPIEGEKGLARVLLRDGSSLWLRGAALKRAAQQAPASLEGELKIGSETATLALPMNQVQLIEPWSARYTLQPLTDAAMTTMSGGEVFGVKMPPTLQPDGSLRLHAPIEISFDLPKGASRLAFTAAIDVGTDTPEDRRRLAGCELVVYEGEERIGGCTLTADTAPKRLNLPLTGGPLRIALESGVNGPVLDRVVLTDAEVLVSE